MNTETSREGSARIYQFPRGGRAALAGRRYGEPGSNPKAVTPSGPPAVYSSSWYHDEAIQESKPQWDR
jgi:hypothetical protein